MIPLSVFPFPSAPCHKRVVSYPIIAFCCRSFNLSIAALPWGRFSFVQPLSLLRRQGRVAAPSVCFAVACILLAAAPTAPPCFRRWRRSSPLPLVGEPLAKRLTFPICQSLPSIGEVASRSDDGEVFCAKRGPDSCPALFLRRKPLRHRCAMPPPLSRGGFGISEKSASSPEAPLLGATATTAASGGNREELLGQRPARCKRQRSRRWVPQPGLVCEAD